MNEQLLKDTHSTFGELYRSMNLFKDEQVDRVPFEGSWTPGQVMEHMYKALAGIPRLCLGDTQEAQRAQDEKAQGIRSLFLDFSTKFKSPDFIEPTETQHDKTRLLAQFKKTEADFVEVIAGQDLSRLCAGAELPGFGQLTCYEWLDFGLVHTQRHIRQLNNIFKTLNPAQ